METWGDIAESYSGPTLVKHVRLRVVPAIEFIAGSPVKFRRYLARPMRDDPAEKRAQDIADGGTQVIHNGRST